MTLSSTDFDPTSRSGTPLVRLQNSFARNSHLSSALFRLHRASEKIARRALLELDPERANFIALTLLNISQHVFPLSIEDDPRLNTRAFGLNFKNPIGAAAGFDKDAETGSALLKFGFGFAEVGTVTPLQQPGNAPPRVFRLVSESAIINRFGFNSAGADVVLKRLVPRARKNGIVGVNIGANKDSPDRIVDYVRLIELFAPVASYITLNISSPNTPGLRSMQQAAVLDDLLARVIDARERVAQRSGSTPVLLKIAPDLSLPDLDDVVGIARSRRIDGLIVGNTSVMRPAALRETANAKEAGGLSGRPLFPLSTRMLAETYVRVEGVFPLIGVGGIDSGAAAVAKFRAGASLIQVCSGFVFRGFELVDEIKKALLDTLAIDGLDNLADIVGTDAASMTAEPWPQ